MTRRRIIVLALLVVGIGASLLHSGKKNDRMYRVNAVFDTGRGVLPGGRVKIAGANVGVVDDIKLTADRKALVRMRIDERFGPFRSDAHCSIRGEGLVGAAVVNCQPGTPSGQPLHDGTDGRPTLPLDRTSVPVNITDFFEIWKLPVRDRLRIVLNELGISLSARGDDLNHLLRRANPTLEKAQRALAILVRQRHALGRSITDSNRALAALAADRAATRRLIREGATTSELTAAHERAIGEGIAGLPPLLERSRDALAELDALNRTSVPLLGDLQRAAPSLEALTKDTVPFADAALPSVRSLGPALKRANATVRELGPFVRRLERFTRSADPAGRLQSALLRSVRDSGTFESLLKVFYVGAASMSRFDKIGHVDPSHLVASACATYASEVDPACDFHYVKQAVRPVRKGARGGVAPNRGGRVPPAPSVGSMPAGVTPKVPQVRLPGLPKLPPVPGVGDADGQVQQVLDDLLGYLLG